MSRVWGKLTSFNLIHEPVGSQMFNDWSQALLEFSEDELKHGLGLAENHQGFLNLGIFKSYCRPVKVPCHRPFLPAPESKRIPKEEFHRKIKQMKQELGL